MDILLNLYLVQHAEPMKKEVDPERPLTEKGWSEIRQVAAFVTERASVQASRILHSGKTRARQTAEALAEYLKPQGGVEAAEGLDPLADPSIWADRLAEQGEDLMLVSHLPHLSKLASRLLCRDEEMMIVDFQMGGVVCLGRDEEGVWSVKWMIVPGLMK